jgi:2-(1,2-epoxy-1,2-dihydrophenyl)acetyl-CoA isomerase
VTELADSADLAARADALAVQIASGAGQSMSAVKKLVLMSFGNGLEEQMEWEGRLIAECADSPDGNEGINAFLEKRRPQFAH